MYSTMFLYFLKTDPAAKLYLSMYHDVHMEPGVLYHYCCTIYNNVVIWKCWVIFSPENIKIYMVCDTVILDYYDLQFYKHFLFFQQRPCDIVLGEFITRVSIYVITYTQVDKLQHISPDIIKLMEIALNRT